MRRWVVERAACTGDTAARAAPEKHDSSRLRGCSGASASPAMQHAFNGRGARYGRLRSAERAARPSGAPAPRSRRIVHIAADGFGYEGTQMRPAHTPTAHCSCAWERARSRPARSSHDSGTRSQSAQRRVWLLLQLNECQAPRLRSRHASRREGRERGGRVRQPASGVGRVRRVAARRADCTVRNSAPAR